MGPLGVVRLLKGPFHVGAENACRPMLAKQLALPAQPLAFGYIWDAVALLMDRHITSIAEHNRIGVFAISVVTNCTFAVLFFTRPRLAINCGSGAGTGSVRLWRFRVWFGYPLFKSVPLFLDFCHG